MESSTQLENGMCSPDRTDAFTLLKEYAERLTVSVSGDRRFLELQSSSTRAAHDAWLREVAELLPKGEEAIEREVRELEELIALYNPLDVVANVSVSNVVLDPETYKEYDSEGSHAIVEYVTVLCLTRGYQDYPNLGNRLVPGVVVADVSARAKELMHKAIWTLALKDLGRGPPRATPLARLRFEVLSRAFLVRYSAYHHHLVDLLIGLLCPLDAEIESLVGFTASEALNIADAIESMFVGCLKEQADTALKEARALGKAVKRYRQRRRVTDGYELDLLRKLASLRPGEARDQIRAWTTGCMYMGLGDTLAFAPDRLADVSGVRDEAVLAFLDLLSLPFGDMEHRYRLPAPTHPMSSTPLVRINDAYLCPVPQMVYWSLRPAIEAAALEARTGQPGRGRATWQRYERHRSDYVEEKAVDYLKAALRPEHIHRNLAYVLSEGGESEQFELDGLLLADASLFLVEVKAGTLSPPARRGAPERMLHDVGELIGEAHRQSLRAERYIAGADCPVFQLADGAVFELDKAKVRRTFLVTVTLEELDAFATNLHQLQDLSLLKERQLPWAVSLTDLRVISELVEFPGQLVHYLLRRLRLNAMPQVRALEELDWFGHYLKEGLYFERILEGGPAPDLLQLGSYTTELDDYFMYSTGQRQTPAPRPRQQMPDAMRAVILELEESRAPGRHDVIVCLLNLDGESREAFVRMANEQRMKARSDRELHDFTMPLPDAGFAITYMFFPSERSQALHRLRTYCELKKYQLRIESWVGLACLVDTDEWVGAVYSAVCPWQHDDTMEAALAAWQSSAVSD